MKAAMSRPMGPVLSAIVSLICVFMAALCFPSASSSSRDPTYLLIAKCIGIALMFAFCLRAVLGSRGLGRVVPLISLVILGLIIIGILHAYTGVFDWVWDRL